MEIVRPFGPGTHPRRNKVKHKLVIYHKGGSNVYKMYPIITREGFFREDNIVATLNASTDEIVQIFRAQEDNIGRLGFIAQVAGLVVLIDDFESYADNTALRSAWVPSDPVNTPVFLETTEPYSGAQSMRIKITKNRSLYDVVTYTFATIQDWSNYDYIKMFCKTNGVRMRLVIQDALGSKVYTNLPDTGGEWREQHLYFDSFRRLGTNNVDWSQVQLMYFQVINDARTRNFYFDDIYVGSEDAMDLDVQIIHLGSTIQTPTPPFNVVPYDDGAIVKTFSIFSPHKAEIIVDYINGLAIGLFDLSNLLIRGDYYGIRLFNKQGAFPVEFFGGPRSLVQSQSFPCYTSADGVTYTEVTGQSMFFYTSSNLETGAYLKNVVLRTDPLNVSEMSLRCFDHYGRLRTDLFHGIVPDNGLIRIDLEHPILIPRGGYGLLQIDDDGQGYDVALECDLDFRILSLIEG